MRVVGFSLHRILVERKEKFEQVPKINQNIDIKEVIKEKNPITNSETVIIKFNFVITYSEDFAKLEFEGNVVLLPEKTDELNSFIKAWKSKKIPEESRAPLFNFIMNKCNVKALDLEDDLSLPLHIPMPRLAPNKE
jgi:hypothetical protein